MNRREFLKLSGLLTTSVAMPRFLSPDLGEIVPDPSRTLERYPYRHGYQIQKPDWSGIDPVRWYNPSDLSGIPASYNNPLDYKLSVDGSDIFEVYRPYYDGWYERGLVSVKWADNEVIAHPGTTIELKSTIGENVVLLVWGNDIPLFLLPPNGFKPSIRYSDGEVTIVPQEGDLPLWIKDYPGGYFMDGMPLWQKPLECDLEGGLNCPIRF